MIDKLLLNAGTLIHLVRETDEDHDIFEYSSEVGIAVHDEQALEALEVYPLELFEVVRKSTYTYNKR